MRNSFLIPANSKKGTLIFNLFLPSDLVIFGTGVLVSLLLLAISETSTDTSTVVLISLPGLICGLLVIPIPNYHNVRMALKSMYLFFSGRRRYIWKGWCFYERFIEESEKTKKESKL